MLSLFVIFCHFFVISLPFFVICLSFYCFFLSSFWERENGEAQLLKNDYHDRPFVISWQHHMQGTNAETLGKPAGGEEG